MTLKTNRGSNGSNRYGFTRIELLTIIACIVLGGGLTSPIRASYKTNTDRAVCSNNLRAIGAGLHQWVNDNPVHKTPWRVTIPYGGTQYYPKAGAAYLEYYTLTNEIRAPQVFACPADTGVSMSSDWENFYSKVQQSRACSYNIAVDCDGSRNNTWVFGDRNMLLGSVTTICSSGMNNVFEVTLGIPGATQIQWTSGVHGPEGNLLMWNGGVEFTSSERLRALTVDPGNADIPGDSTHILKARPF